MDNSKRHVYSKALGQNFLRDKNILRYEARLIAPEGKVVLEIGAGDGRLTREILNLNPKRIYAVELDPRWLNELVGVSDTRLHVIEGDIRKIQFPSDVDVVVGNLPYYLSSKIIFMLPHLNISRAVFMIQKEFGEKMVARSNEKNYGRLSVTSQIFFDVRLHKVIPKHLFVPAPKVDSIIVELVLKHTTLPKSSEDVIRTLFSHKNKKIRSTYPNAPEKWLDIRPRTMDPEDVLEFINDLSYDSPRRT